jgi:hypothetical protein
VQHIGHAHSREGSGNLLACLPLAERNIENGCGDYVGLHNRERFHKVQSSKRFATGILDCEFKIEENQGLIVEHQYAARLGRGWVERSHA